MCVCVCVSVVCRSRLHALVHVTYDKHSTGSEWRLCSAAELIFFCRRARAHVRVVAVRERKRGARTLCVCVCVGANSTCALVRTRTHTHTVLVAVRERERARARSPHKQVDARDECAGKLQMCRRHRV